MKITVSASTKEVAALIKEVLGQREGGEAADQKEQEKLLSKLIYALVPILSDGKVKRG